MTAQQTFSRGDITLANWRQHPFSQWSFQNVEELVPTAEITPPGAPEDPVAEPGLIASLSIVLADGRSKTALEHLRQSYADRFVMMRDGVVLDEWLAPHAEAERPHIIYSISKSVTGMLAGIAVGDGKLDPDARRQRLRQGQARQRLSRGPRARPARHDGEPRFRGELSRHERRFRPLSSRDAVESRAQRRQAGNHARGAGIAQAARPSARHHLLLRLAQHRHARDWSSRRRSASASTPTSRTGCGRRWARAALPMSPSNASARRARPAASA